MAENNPPPTLKLFYFFSNRLIRYIMYKNIERKLMAEKQFFLSKLNNFGIRLQQTQKWFDVPPIMRQSCYWIFVEVLQYYAEL